MIHEDYAGLPHSCAFNKVCCMKATGKVVPYGAAAKKPERNLTLSL